MIFDYLEVNPDESRFWKDKVQTAEKNAPDVHEVSRHLETELWAYLVERSSVVSPFKEEAAHEGLPRMSMQNLADHLLRMWTAPRTKKKRSTPGSYA